MKRPLAIAVTSLSIGSLLVPHSAPAQDAVPASGQANELHAAPLTLSACEAGEQCATWIFVNAKGKGTGPAGEIEDLTVERPDEHSVLIHRSDSAGPSTGLTATYKGTANGDRVEGTVTSTWPGHWDSMTRKWYATLGVSPSTASASGPPPVIHVCGNNCFTLLLRNGKYVREDGVDDTWTIESFTSSKVILHRHDAPQVWNDYSTDVVYAGDVSNDHIVNLKVANKPVPSIRIAWGAALNAVPGSNVERDRARSQMSGLEMLLLLGIAAASLDGDSGPGDGNRGEHATRRCLQWHPYDSSMQSGSCMAWSN